jgi:hypothetical protein
MQWISFDVGRKAHIGTKIPDARLRSHTSRSRPDTRLLWLTQRDTERAGGRAGGRAGVSPASAQHADSNDMQPNRYVYW